MRLFLRLAKNEKLIPFNYQRKLTGCIHKWIGKRNQQHGIISLYSFSWLQNTRATKNGLWLTSDSYLYLSFYEKHLVKEVISGILDQPDMFNGTKVQEVLISNKQEFQEKQRFFSSSPILIKRTLQSKKQKHYTFFDNEANKLMTETLHSKLEYAGLDTNGVTVAFDSNYPKPRTKLIKYGAIKNKVNLCPIIVSGSEKQVAFAHDVGIGNCTGIGFGAIKAMNNE